MNDLELKLSTSERKKTVSMLEEVNDGYSYQLVLVVDGEVYSTVWKNKKTEKEIDDIFKRQALMISEGNLTVNR